MLPTEEEKTKILEAQMANPDIPLGNAEQFLLTLSSITELSARLSLWAFKLDYDGVEAVSKRNFLLKTIFLHCTHVWFWFYMWFPYDFSYDFNSDFHMISSLQEVAEPLHDLKQGMEELKNNKTFKFILSAMLQIGNFLNGAQVSTNQHVPPS